jgi:ubiquinone/menaquinone biosynthesis C-methylase UbiE
VVAEPVVYDAVQTLAGTGQLNARLATYLAPLPTGAVIVDVGGGTGLPRRLLPDDSRYVCVDADLVKLRGFRGKHGLGEAVCGDAAALPLPDSRFDVVVCKMVGHHLTDSQLAGMFKECARVLRPGARMLFLDPVQATDRVRSRLLWRYDRGSYPRAPESLKEAMAVEFDINEWSVFAIHHRYVLGVGTKPVTAPPHEWGGQVGH